MQILFEDLTSFKSNSNYIVYFTFVHLVGNNIIFSLQSDTVIINFNMHNFRFRIIRNGFEHFLYCIALVIV